MTFEEKVEKLRAFGVGVVEVQDYFPGDAAPYRYATLKHFAQPDEIDAAKWLQLAIDVGGYFTVYIRGTIAPCISVQRPLTADEIGDNPPCATRAVR